MGSISKFCERMKYWCDEANLGYDQSNRWDIRVGGECDCSSLVIFALREAGFDTGSASYTGDMSDNLTKRGWKRLKADISTCKPGDILLNDVHHVCAVISGYGWNARIAQASIDERGRASGGQSGDQTDGETNTKPVYTYRYGWDCILRYGGSDDIPVDDGELEVDGWLGSKSISAWQKALKTTVDGVVSGQLPEYKVCFARFETIEFDGGGSDLIRVVQRIVGVPDPTGVAGPHTIALIQAFLTGKGYSCANDRVGVCGDGTAKAIQKSLNDGVWK